MAFQDAYLKLTRLSDSAVLQVTGDAEFTRDQAGNLTVTWRDPLKSRAPAQRLTRPDLDGWVSENVEQYRNRDRAYEAYTDPGGALLSVEWRELDPWAGALIAAQTLFAVLTVGSVTAQASGDTISLVFYRADYRLERSTGVQESSS